MRVGDRVATRLGHGTVVRLGDYIDGAGRPTVTLDLDYSSERYGWRVTMSAAEVEPIG